VNVNFKAIFSGGFRNFWRGGLEGRGSGGFLKSPSGSRAKPWWGSEGPGSSDEFLHVKDVFYIKMTCLKLPRIGRITAKQTRLSYLSMLSPNIHVYSRTTAVWFYFNPPPFQYDEGIVKVSVLIFRVGHVRAKMHIFDWAVYYIVPYIIHTYIYILFFFP
jgi:hypothetical protein